MSRELDMINGGIVLVTGLFCFCCIIYLVMIYYRVKGHFRLDSGFFSFLLGFLIWGVGRCMLGVIELWHGMEAIISSDLLIILIHASSLLAVWFIFFGIYKKWWAIEEFVRRPLVVGRETPLADLREIANQIFDEAKRPEE